MAFSKRPILSIALAAAAGSTVATGARAQLRVVTWNISNYQGQADRDSAIQTAVFGVFEGRSMNPDLLLLQEFDDAASLTRFVSLLNAVSGANSWGAAAFITGPDSQSVCVYRRSKVQLIGSTIAAISDGTTSDQPRHTYRYDVRPVGYTAAAATIGCYNVHLKSGSTGDDNARRLIETTRIRDNAEGQNTNGPGTGLPAGYQFMIAGDMNMQNASQTSYTQLIGSQAVNTGRFFDPIRSGNNGTGAGNNGSWNNQSAYRFIHTQDPTGQGGMDDRHDQILVSFGLIDGLGMDYIGNPVAAYSLTTWNDPNHSYRVWGNDGSSYDAQLTTTGNTMVGPTIAQALKTAATTAGGHLPVYLDLRVPPELSAPITVDFGSVAQGSTAQRSISVGNGGDTALWNAAGIAGLSYTLAASAGFTAPGGTFTEAAGGGLNAHTISMSTSAPGIKSGTITIASNSPDEPARIVVLSGTVVPPNTPPTANAGIDFARTDSDGSGAEVVALDGSASADSDGNIVLYRWTEGLTQLAAGPSPTANVSLPIGVHTIQLDVTDNANASTSDTVVVTVHPRPNQPPTADAGSDQSVTDADGSGSEPVTLDGAASTDADGIITLYTWKEGATTLAAGPSPTANLALPVGEHTLTLTVTDDDLATATDTVIVTVGERPNSPPAADAGADQSATDTESDGSESVTLDGSASTDTDGMIVAWAWSTPELGQIAAGQSPTVVLPVGEHVVTLVVTDDDSATATDTVTITVSRCIADYNTDGGIDGADVDAFFADWEAGAPGADINADGGIDGADVEAFFLRWEAGLC